jgi:serine/threonine-protein kinase RsbW
LKTRKSKIKRLIVKSRTDNLSSIRNFIREFAEEIGIAGNDVGNIILAVDEACTNIIKHAYKSYPDGQIIIKLKYSDKKFTILIKDYGISFEPEQIPDPDLQKYYRQRKVGGLGLYLMRSLMDEVEYVSVPGKYNQVSLSKKFISNP